MTLRRLVVVRVVRRRELHCPGAELHIDKLREKLDPKDRIRAIQEELAGFLLKEVIAKKGEHFEDDDELNMT